MQKFHGKSVKLYMNSESVGYVLTYWLTYRKTNGCSMSKTKTLYKGFISIDRIPFVIHFTE